MIWGHTGKGKLSHTILQGYQIMNFNISIRATGLETVFLVEFVLYISTCLEIFKNYYPAADSDFNLWQKIKMAATGFF